MATPGEIKIKGQKELEAAFMQLHKETLVALQPALLEIAEIVRKDAEQKAGLNISNIGPRWERMRIGAKLSGVYVVPRTRRTVGPPRKNLADLLMNRAMQPALDEHESEVVERLDMLLNVSAAKAGFF